MLSALIVFRSEQTATRLRDALDALGVAPDISHTANSAVAALERKTYGAVVLEDELPGGGSLAVFDALDRLEHDRPPLILVGVPRAVLPELRQSSADRVEYVATPETEAEVDRLALRLRSRLVDSERPEARGGAIGMSADALGGSAAARAEGRGRPYLAIIVVLIILLGLLALLSTLPPTLPTG